MISNCQRCANRNSCEEKDNFIKLSNTLIKNIRDWDKDPTMHSYFSFSLRCDYFYEEHVEGYCEGEMESRTNYAV